MSSDQYSDDNTNWQCSTSVHVCGQLVYLLA